MCSTSRGPVGEAPLAHPAAPCPDPLRPERDDHSHSLQLNTLSGDISSDKRGVQGVPVPWGAVPPLPAPAEADYQAKTA